MASRVYDVEAILAELKACAELSPPAKVETWWRVSARQDLQDKTVMMKLETSKEGESADETLAGSSGLSVETSGGLVGYEKGAPRSTLAPHDSKLVERNRVYTIQCPHCKIAIKLGLD